MVKGVYKMKPECKHNFEAMDASSIYCTECGKAEWEIHQEIGYKNGVQAERERIIGICNTYCYCKEIQSQKPKCMIHYLIEEISKKAM